MSTFRPEHSSVVNAWREYESAAEWCARRHIDGTIGSRLPDGLSITAARLIQDDPEAFERRVRENAYAISMEKAEGGAP